MASIFPGLERERGCCSAKGVRNDLIELSNVQNPTYGVSATYYKLGPNLTTTLMLNNKGPEPIMAMPRIYSLSGTQLDLAPISVPATSYLDVDMNVLLAAAGPDFREGSLKINYQGGDYQLGAQVKMVNEQNGLIWAEQLVYTSKFVSNKLESVWWLLNENMETRLVVSNTSYSSVTVTLSVDGTTPHQSAPVQITLARNETRVLDIMADLVGEPYGTLHNKGGVSISHTGNPGAVLARMFVAKPSHGYSASLPFIDPENTASQRWHGNGLRLKNLNGASLTPLLIARNTSEQISRIRGKIPYTRPNGEMAVANIPLTQIAPTATKIINLQTFLNGANVPASVNYAGIELEYDTPKGTVIVQIQSVSQNGEHVFQVPMFDPQKTPSSAGGYPWKADGDFHTLLYIKNETDQPKRYTAYLTYAGGSYSLGMQEIKRNQTVAVDFRKIRDNQTPDVNGEIIPINVESGQISWSVAGNDNKTLSGRSEQISVSRGVASTYDCRNCCPNEFFDGAIDPNSFYTTVGGFTSLEATQQDVNCYDYVYPPYPVNVSLWESTEPLVVEIHANGFAEAVGTGNAFITANWSSGRYHSESGSFECIYEPLNILREAPVEVVPTVESIKASIPKSFQVGTDDFTTTNQQLAFATDSSDLAVFFKGGEPINISAVNVDPPSSAGLVRWKLERDPSDPTSLDTGLPTLNSQIGQSVEILPTKAGNFRLINWIDLNGNGEFDPPTGIETGELLKVLKFVIVRAELAICTIRTNNGFESTGGFPGEINLQTSEDVAGSCQIVLRSGGNSQTVGLDKIKLGQVSNVSNLTFVTQFKTGTYFIEAAETTPLPSLVDTENSQTNGGSTIFRDSSDEDISGNPGGGERREITFNYRPTIYFPENHIDNETLWESVTGGFFYHDYIVGFSELFSNNFVLFADAGWSVTYDGSKNEMGEWVRTSAQVSIRNIPLPPDEMSAVSLNSLIGSGGTTMPANNSSNIRVTGGRFVFVIQYSD